MRRRTVLAIVGSILVGCGTLLEVGDDVGPAGDAGEFDAVESDGAIAPDAASVDGATADAAVPFCSTVDAQFCWSFDEGLLTTGLSLRAFNGEAGITGAALSAPGALEAAMAGDGGYGGLWLDGPSSPEALRCDVDLFVERAVAPSVNDVSLLQHDYDGSSFATTPALMARAVGTDISLGLKFDLTSDPLAVTATVPSGQWVHVYLESEHTGGKWILRARAGNGSLVTRDAGPRASLPRFDRVFVGVGSLIQASWTVRFDNFFCTWR